MRKTNIGNIEILIDPEENRVMILDDFHIAIIRDIETPIKEPGRARKIYNRLRRSLK